MFRLMKFPEYKYANKYLFQTIRVFINLKQMMDMSFPGADNLFQEDNLEDLEMKQNYYQ